MQFEQNRNETDPSRVETQKAAAVRALANYMVYESSTKDTKVANAMTQFQKPSPSSMNTNGKEEGGV